MRITTSIDDQQFSAPAEEGTNEEITKVRQAIRTTADETAKEIETKGRADIAGAGRFGSRWTDGFRVEKTEDQTGVTLTVTHDVPYWRVFEKGATIQGRPLLWIPLSFGGAEGTRAGDRGNLFRVDRIRGGAPLLLDRTSKQPIYFGKESVTIPKKFHIEEIVQKAAEEMGPRLQAHLAASEKG